MTQSPDPYAPGVAGLSPARVEAARIDKCIESYGTLRAALERLAAHCLAREDMTGHGIASAALTAAEQGRK